MINDESLSRTEFLVNCLPLVWTSNEALVVAGGGVRNGYGGGGGSGGGGYGKGYEMYAPSHPQAVNQYVREYNYYAGEEPEDDYDQALQDYQEAAARKYCINAY